MRNLTVDQLNLLNMYSTYLDKPEHPLFTLSTLLDSEKTEDVLTLIQTISGSPNRTVAASYFMRRLGMFIAMQFYNLAVYNEVWKGDWNRLVFGAKEEYGKLSISMFCLAEDWKDIDDVDRQYTIKQVL